MTGSEQSELQDGLERIEVVVDRSLRLHVIDEQKVRPTCFDVVERITRVLSI